MLPSLSLRRLEPGSLRWELIAMKLILMEFYRQNWDGGFSGTERELDLLLSRAADVIDNAIYISGITVKTVPLRWQDRVYKAVCAQADYIDSIGGIDCMNDSGRGTVTLGSFSYSDWNASTSSSGACELCSQAESYLLPTGLLYKGVRVL